MSEAYDDLIIFEGDIAAQLEEDASRARTLDELAPEEQLALMRFQESSATLQAYGHLCLELGLPASAPVADVTAALGRLDLTLEEASDWLPACNYDLVCFRQTMFEGLRLGRRRVADRRTKRLTITAALGALAVAIWRWRKR